MITKQILKTIYYIPWGIAEGHLTHHGRGSMDRNTCVRVVIPEEIQKLILS